MTFTYPNNKSPENAEDFFLMDQTDIFQIYSQKKKKMFSHFFCFYKKEEMNQKQINVQI